MKRGSFPAALYGRPASTLSLPAGIPARRAVLSASGTLRCGNHVVTGENLVARLCCELVEAGLDDCALIITYADRTPALFVVSFHDTAWPPDRLRQ